MKRTSVLSTGSPLQRAQDRPPPPHKEHGRGLVKVDRLSRAKRTFPSHSYHTPTARTGSGLANLSYSFLYARGKMESIFTDFPVTECTEKVVRK